MEDESKSHSIEMTTNLTPINEARKASTKAPRTRKKLEPIRTTISRANPSVTPYPMTAVPPTAEKEKLRKESQEGVREKVKIATEVTLNPQTLLILSSKSSRIR